MKTNYFICLIAWMLVTACSKPEYKKISDSHYIYENYIGAYTSGHLNIGDAFVIDFIKVSIDSSQIGKEFNPSNYFLQPELPGKMIWKSLNRLEFIPDPGSMHTKGDYSLYLNLENLFPDLAREYCNVVFDIKYLPLVMTIDWEFPRQDPTQESYMYLEGILHTNATIPAEKLAGTLKAYDDDNKLQLVIDPVENNPKQFRIVLKELKRNEKENEITVTLVNPWNEISNSNFTFIIPALGDFIVTGVKKDHSSTGHYSIYFSNILNTEQDIRGLIKVQDQSYEIALNKNIDNIQFELNKESINQTGNIIVGNWIKDKSGKSLKNDFVYNYNLSQEKPRIKFLSSGTILPYADNIIMPFEAINLDKVDVEIFKLFSNNVLYNLHFNIMKYEDNYNLVRLGKVIYQNVVELNSLNPESNINEYKRYALDLSKIVKAEPGAFYQLRLSFKPEYSRYFCSGGKPEIPEDFYYMETGDPKFKSTWREYAHYDFGVNSGINDTRDPCSMSYYYRDNFAKESFYASNISIVLKYSAATSNSFCLVQNIQTGLAVEQATVSFYDRQLQLLSEEKTDERGVVASNLPSEAKIVVARWNDHYAYLLIEEGKSMSQSEFDISGVAIQDGIKVAIYTERGVWRPGDTIMYNAVVFAESQMLSQNIPVELILKNPLGKVIYKAVESKHVKGLYAFQVPTSLQDITGVYSSQLSVGQSNFYKNLLIESVKPNRYLVNWNINESIKFQDLNQDFLMSATHLTGGAATNLKAEVTLKLIYKNPQFEKYKNYNFTNPEEQKSELKLELANSRLDISGRLMIKKPNYAHSKKSGDYSAQLQTFLTDESGELSTDYFPFEVQAFNEYVGVKLPKGIFGQRRLQVGEEQIVEFVAVDGAGKPLPNRKLKIDLFKVNYEWWYEMRSGFVGSYQKNNFKSLVHSVTLLTDVNGKAIMPITLQEYDRYYISASSLNNGYTSGDYFYTSWPYDESQKEFANIIEFQTSSESYKVGDLASVKLPPAEGGKYHICLIKANSILQYKSIPADKSGSNFEFKVEKHMAPNVYIDVSYIQARATKNNDLPLRLYGVKSIKIDDSDRQLQPKIVVKDVIKPEEKFIVEVNEERGREMAYQLFIVDEGLLSLTRFKTPNPYNDLMAKEALAMLSWDNYDEIIGSFNGKLEQIFSIGGDQAIDPNSVEAVKRFKPVLLRSGPQLLAKGKVAKHEFIISNYTGAVRVMIIANAEQSAGSAEKGIKVKQEIMVQIGAPRVFSIADEISLPVTVYANDAGIKTIDLKLSANGPVSILEKNSKQIYFKEPGPQTVFFKVQGNGMTGSTEFVASASSGNFSARHNLSIPVSNPNPWSKSVNQLWIQAGEKVEYSLKGFGIPQTRKIQLELSGMPGLSISTAVDHLVQYPYGCLEQTISSLFPQLYLSSLTTLDDQKQKEIAQNISVGMEKLRRFQLADGSFSYWPGLSEVSEWTTCYAGHFLVLARKMGYKVPDDLLKRWQQFQWSSSQKFTVGSMPYNQDKFNIQAYSLFVLSLSGKPNYSAMNQLFQLKERTPLVVSFLAGAFVNAGKKELAQKLINDKPIALKPYRETGGNLGSDIRDEAIVGLSQYWTGHDAEAASILHRLVKKHTDVRFYTTQELSYIFQLLVGIYGEQAVTNGEIHYSWNGKTEAINLKQIWKTVDLKNANEGILVLNNKSSFPVGVNVIQTAQEDLYKAVEEKKGLELKFWYEASPANKWKSGENIKAIVQIVNTSATRSIENLALSLNFPSGLELINERWELGYQIPYGVSYQDFRDNRLINYFNIKKGEKIQWIIPVKAGIPGHYPSPLIVCEAMYDPTVYAKLKPAPVVIESN